MEPCSDSEDEDLIKFQQKFKTQTKNIKKQNEESENDSDYSDDLGKDLKKSLKGIKHKRFDKHGNLVSDDDDDDGGMASEDQEESDIGDESEEEDDQEGSDEDFSEEEDSQVVEEEYNKLKRTVLESSDEEHIEDEEESNEVDPYATVRKELIDMSFEDRQKLKNKLGSKIYNKIVNSGKQKQTTIQTASEVDKEHKNRPKEMSSKKRVPIFRKVIEVKRKLNRDPRFDDLSGTFDEKQFKHSYAFLEEMKQKEKKQIVRAMKKEKDKSRKSELKSLANRYKQLEDSSKRKEKTNSLLNQWKTRERELVRDGKKPYFLKQSDVKKLELADKYKELKEKGGLEKYLAKRRKKNASREKKKLHM
ncbi:hypothetical protein LOTGIDRAFT_234962 [Lottia gigantea]|uniref:rRNA biogenesis protein RRP36 n=1 Tax=Lottia gigantea TaxID=225164 RepID=V3Z9T8_LOTGI|nr:hypothetical protein LOTGIDRAFT_234962 [Lottia gigantea]ESO87718.1 hypothetical protein LOTGIDRAFT_234962 [Lottia gigantea]